MSSTGSATTTTPPTSTDFSHRKRIVVRAKPSQKTLSAFQLTAPEAFTLPDGEDVRGRNGEWVLLHGLIVVDVIPPAMFAERFEEVVENTLTIAGTVRARLEKALGFGSTLTPEHLAAAVERLARLSIGTIDLDFTPGQWEELQHRASKRGISLEALVQQVVDRITSEFWQS